MSRPVVVRSRMDGGVRSSRRGHCCSGERGCDRAVEGDGLASIARILLRGEARGGPAACRGEGERAQEDRLAASQLSRPGEADGVLADATRTNPSIAAVLAPRPSSVGACGLRPESMNGITAWRNRTLQHTSHLLLPDGCNCLNTCVPACSFRVAQVNYLILAYQRDSLFRAGFHATIHLHIFRLASLPRLVECRPPRPSGSFKATRTKLPPRFSSLTRFRLAHLVSAFAGWAGGHRPANQRQAYCPWSLTSEHASSLEKY